MSSIDQYISNSDQVRRSGRGQDKQGERDLDRAFIVTTAPVVVREAVPVHGELYLLERFSSQILHQAEKPDEL